MQASFIGLGAAGARAARGKEEGDGGGGRGGWGLGGWGLGGGICRRHHRQLAWYMVPEKQSAPSPCRSCSPHRLLPLPLYPDNLHRPALFLISLFFSSLLSPHSSRILSVLNHQQPTPAQHCRCWRYGSSCCRCCGMCSFYPLPALVRVVGCPRFLAAFGVQLN